MSTRPFVSLARRRCRCRPSEPGGGVLSVPRCRAAVGGVRGIGVVNLDTSGSRGRRAVDEHDRATRAARRSGSARWFEEISRRVRPRRRGCRRWCHSGAAVRTVLPTGDAAAVATSGSRSRSLAIGLATRQVDGTGKVQVSASLYRRLAWTTSSGSLGARGVGVARRRRGVRAPAPHGGRSKVDSRRSRVGC